MFPSSAYLQVQLHLVLFYFRVMGFIGQKIILKLRSSRTSAKKD
jgi:hypothetical protein